MQKIVRIGPSHSVFSVFPSLGELRRHMQLCAEGLNYDAGKVALSRQYRDAIRGRCRLGWFPRF